MSSQSQEKAKKCKYTLNDIEHQFIVDENNNVIGGEFNLPDDIVVSWIVQGGFFRIACNNEFIIESSDPRHLYGSKKIIDSDINRDLFLSSEEFNCVKQADRENDILNTISPEKQAGFRKAMRLAKAMLVKFRNRSNLSLEVFIKLIESGEQEQENEVR